MGRYVFKVPDIGEGTAEAEIGDWHIEVGKTVGEDDLLVEMLTDKATVEITSPVNGKVLHVFGEKGDKRPIGSDLIVFEVDGAGNTQDAPDLPADPTVPSAPSPQAPPPKKPAAAKPPEPAPPAAAAKAPPRTSTPAFATRTPGEPPQASPAVRMKAREHGIELQFVPGAGPGGRITQDDLDAFIASGGAGVVAQGAMSKRREGADEIKVIGLRRKIAERLQDTKRRIPHFSYIEEVDVTALESLRGSLNARHGKTRPKLTLLPFLIKALVVALPDFPQINATFDDENGVVHHHRPVHAGIATQTPNGLVVTVLQHAEDRSLWDMAGELIRLSAVARDGKATKAELSGSTITITSLGAIGGVATTPVINSPEVAIVGVNKMIERPVVLDGQIAVRKMMNLSSSFDHRVVDGWDAALFVQRVKQMLEQPAMLFMEDA